ncbi:MAG: hypothetical protein WAM14_12175 [Candidatus Nitrosopolaris sp.]
MLDRLSNSTAANTTNNTSSLLKPGNTAANTVVLDAKMLQLTASNKPQDIATLAYIWGYPLVTVAGSFTYYTNPKTPPSPGEGPVNTINFAFCIWQCLVGSYKRTCCSYNTSN